MPKLRLWSDTRFRLRELIIPTAVCVLSLPVLFPYVFSRGHVIAPGYKLYELAPWSHYDSPDSSPHAKYDPAFEYMLTWVPWYIVAQEAWSHGEWPLWNPYQLTGVPLFANGQTAFLYPPKILFAFCNVHVAGTINIILKVWLAALTAYYCARTLGLNLGASLLVSILWMLAPMRMFWLFWSPADTLVWLPLQYCGAESLVHGRRRRGFALILVSGTLLLLAGHPETAFTAGLGTGMYFILRVVYRYWKAPGTALMLSGLALSAWLCALLLSAAQLLPLIEYIANSWTAAERARLAPTTSTARAFICMFVPAFRGITYAASDVSHEFGNSNWTAMYYPGWPVWIGLCLFASKLIGRDRDRFFHPRTVCLTIVSGLFLAYIFGTRLFPWIDTLPLARVMLRPWFYPFALFGMIVVAVESIQAWFSTPRRPHNLVLPVFYQFVIVFLVMVAYHDVRNGALPETARFLDRHVLFMWIVALAAITTLALSCLPRARTVALPALLGLCLLDLLRIGSGIHPTCPLQKAEFVPQLIQELKKGNDEGRVSTMDEQTMRAVLPRGLLQTYGVEDLLGHEGLLPQRLIRFYASCNLFGNMYDTFSIRYVLRPSEYGVSNSNRFVASGEIDGYRLLRVPTAWPRLKLIGDVQVIEDLATMYDLMNKKDFDPSKTALLESPLPHGVEFEPGSTPSPGDVKLVRRTPNTVVANVRANRNAVLFLSDQYYPGWKAKIDGNATEVFPVYSLFRGILVTPGSHQVVFYFDPPSLRIGIWLSSATCALLGVAAIRLLIARKKPYIEPRAN